MGRHHDRNSRRLAGHIDAHVRRGGNNERRKLDGHLTTLHADHATLRITHFGASHGALYLDVAVYAAFDTTTIDNHGVHTGQTMGPVTVRCVVGNNVDNAQHLKRWADQNTPVTAEIVIAEPQRRRWRRTAPPFVHSVRIEDGHHNTFDIAIALEGPAGDNHRRRA